MSSHIPDLDALKSITEQDPIDDESKDAALPEPDLPQGDDVKNDEVPEDADAPEGDEAPEV